MNYTVIKTNTSETHHLTYKGEGAKYKVGDEVLVEEVGGRKCIGEVIWYDFTEGTYLIKFEEDYYGDKEVVLPEVAID